MDIESSKILLHRSTSTADYSEVRTQEPLSDLDSPLHARAENKVIVDGLVDGEMGVRSDDDDEFISADVKMILRKRRGWGHDDSLCTNDLDLLGEDDDVLAEEDDAGCPLPSTPEDTQLIEAEVCILDQNWHRSTMFIRNEISVDQSYVISVLQIQKINCYIIK